MAHRQQAENLEGRWDPEWVRAYNRLEEEARQRDEQQNAQFFASRPVGSARDPRCTSHAVYIQTSGHVHHLSKVGCGVFWALA